MFVALKKNAKAMNAAKIAAGMFLPGAGAAMLVTELIGATLGSQEDASASLKKAADEAALQHELNVQHALLTLAEGRARIARELAIARRIDTAEEVEIEEFYDSAREGQAGLNVTGKAVSLGASGAGKHVSKRVYRFKGWRDGGLEALMAQMEKMSPEELEALKSADAQD